MTTTIKKQNATTRPGYKHTPLGWIPDDWQTKQLKAIVDGKRTIRYGIVQPGAYDAKGRYMVRGQDYSFGWEMPDSFFRVSEAVETKYKNARLKPNDILITIVGAGTGNTALVPEWLDGANITQTTARVAIDEDEAHYKYCYYFLSSPFGEKLTRENVKGGAQPGLNCGDIEKYLLILPPLPEQRKIAAILSTWDDAIQQTQALITQLQKRNKGLAQQLLKPKKEWKVVKLSDLFDRITDRNEEGNDNVVTISAQRGFVKQETFFKKRVASDTLLDYFLVNRGDFCYNKSYSTGYDWGATKRLNDFDKAVVTTLYICFRIKNEQTTSGRFFEHFFESGILDKGLSKIAHEGGRAHGLLNVTPSDFFSLKISVPDIKEQDAIASVLDNANKELKRQQEYLNTLQVQKKGLMQQLLTGAIRVKIENKKM